jgi:hypothetical protein
VTDPQPKLGFLGFVITRLGWPGILVISLLSIPLGILAGNVIMWPLSLAYLFGVHLTDGMAFFLIALPFVLIFLAAKFFPRQGDAFFDFLGKLYGLGLASFAFFFFFVIFPAMFIGLPLLFAVSYFLEHPLPAWTMFPLGLAGVALFMIFRKLYKHKRSPDGTK